MAKWKPIIAVDFDGVINSYESGWLGENTEEQLPDPPVPGAIAFLVALEQNDEVEVVIFTARARTLKGQLAIHLWLAKYGMSSIPMITAEKPPAVVYLDDRGWCFTGTFPSLEELLAFQPWNKSGWEPKDE